MLLEIFRCISGISFQSIFVNQNRKDAVREHTIVLKHGLSWPDPTYFLRHPSQLSLVIAFDAVSFRESLANLVLAMPYPAFDALRSPLHLTR